MILPIWVMLFGSAWLIAWRRLPLASYVLSSKHESKDDQGMLRRAEGWPESAQADLAQAALEIEGELQQDTYTATPEEVTAIERGLKEAEQDKFATDSEVEAVLGKYRR